MTEIDFDKLNRELKESAAARDTEKTVPVPFDIFFPSIYRKLLQKYMDKADEVKDIDYYFDLESNGPALFMRKLIRRANKFLFLKNFDNQRKFNSIMQDSIMLMSTHIQNMEKLIEKDMQTIQSLEARIKKLEGRI